MDESQLIVVSVPKYQSEHCWHWLFHIAHIKNNNCQTFDFKLK